jgi:thioredoxin-like negative regulator of GroEL
LFVLSQSRSERARTIIAGVARGNTNPDLQRSAIRLLAQSNSPDAIATLSTLYRADQSMEIKRTIISSLSQSHNNTAAINALIAIARTERDNDLRMQVVRHLSDCRAAECKQFLLEILQK